MRFCPPDLINFKQFKIFYEALKLNFLKYLYRIYIELYIRTSHTKMGIVKYFCVMQ